MGGPKLSLSQNMFEITCTLCEIFPAFTPMQIRREKAREVFKLIERVNNRPKQEEREQEQVIRKPAGNNWF